MNGAPLLAGARLVRSCGMSHSCLWSATPRSPLTRRRLPASLEASVISAWEPRSHIHPIIKTENVRSGLNLCATNLWGWRPSLWNIPSAVSVTQPCSVSLWEANLSAFPMMCLRNRFPGQPNTLRGSFARRVFYLHFPVSLQGCRLIQTSRGGECERVIGEKIHLVDVRVCQTAWFYASTQ